MMWFYAKKNNKKAFSEAILRDVEKEMAKPRIVESVRRATTVDPGRREPRKPRNALRTVLTGFPRSQCPGDVRLIVRFV